MKGNFGLMKILSGKFKILFGVLVLFALVLGFQNCGTSEFGRRDGEFSKIASQDSDVDGLTNAQEAEFGTNPTNPDTDGDGLNDGSEINAFSTDPLNVDTDGGGLNDGDEVSLGLNPLDNADDTLTPDSDHDADGLTLDVETGLGTDPNNPDTDGDGLNDGLEVNTHETDPLVMDSDDGGVNDGLEVSRGTNPNLGNDDRKADDSDNDGLLDTQEAQLGTDPNNSDTDGDGLKDGAEVFVHQTNPVVADTDGGGVNDGDEVSLATNPVNPEDDIPFPAYDDDSDGLTNQQEADLGTNASIADTDGDGLTDGSEVNLHGSNPLVRDTDSGGVSDGLEVANGSSPTLSTDDFDNQDPDSDGLTNPQEVSLGTDPNNSDTDSDSLSDGSEIFAYQTSPLNVDTDMGGVNDGYEVSQAMNPLDALDDQLLINLDTDGDGLTDQEELDLGTNPSLADTDGDGLSDGTEHNTVKTNPLIADTDMGGVPDGIELSIGSDPLNISDDFSGLGETGQLISRYGLWSDQDLIRIPLNQNYVSDVTSYSGSQTGAANYNYRSASANLINGPQTESRVLKIFLYEGSDGLSLNFVASSDNSGTAKWENTNLEITVYNNNKQDRVLLSDDRNEVKISSVTDAYNVYSANLRYINNSDGGVIGPIAGEDYLVHVNMLKVDELTEVQFVQADGTVVNLDPSKQAYLIGKRKLLSFGDGDQKLYFDKFPEQISKTGNAEFQFFLEPSTEVETLCSLDGTALTPCSQNAPMLFTNLENGIHEFIVVVNDGSESPKSYKYVWGVYSNTDGYYSELCAKAKSSGNLVSVDYNVGFNQTASVCQWSNGDNLEAKNGYMQAFVNQNISIDLGEDFHLCDASISTSNSSDDDSGSSFRYDDNFYLNLNGKVLATNKVSVLNVTENDSLAYNWSALKGRRDVNRLSADELYCRGGVAGQTCNIPLTDRDGSFSLSINESSIAPVLNRGFNKSMNFSMVVIGDNDNSDCQHTGLSLKLNVKGVRRN